MNKLIDLENVYQRELKNLYSKQEINSIFRILIEFEFKKKFFSFMLEDKLLSELGFKKILSHVELLKNGYPVHYIIGFKQFCNCTIRVNEKVLIPRGETEELVFWIRDHIKPKQRVLDLCTGSGCISIALAKNNNCKLTAVDISKEALILAKQNSKINNTSVKFFCVDVLKSNFEFLKKQHIIVSNPPYVLNSQKKYMHKNVLCFEPHLALFVEDKNPLIFYEKIISISKIKLIKDGFLFFEINDSFGVQIFNLLEKNGFKNITIKNDIHEKPRLVKAQLI